jgi:hypothetical protein
VIPDAAWTAVPPDDPPDVPRWVEGVARAAELSDRERHAYKWAIHLLSRLTGQVTSTAIMGLLSTRPELPASAAVVDVSAGFIPHSPTTGSSPRTSRDARLQFDAPSVAVGGLRYSFGLVVGVAAPVETSLELSRDTLPSQVVSVSGLPVVAEFREVILNAPPNPAGTTSACYAQPRSSKRFYGPSWSAGVVVARHSLSSVGFAAGALVPMASGASLPVVDIDDGTTIDAAILDLGSLPPGASSIKLAPAVAPGSSVSIRTASAPFAAQVLRINDHPSYFGNLIAHRLFVDTVGTIGDSGSHMTRSPHGDSAGVYVGTTGGSVPEGIAQSMRQVVQYFDVDLLD